MASDGIRDLVERFAEQIEGIIRDEIRRGFATALGDVPSPAPRRAPARSAPRSAPAPKPVAAASAPVAFTRKGRRKGEKRTPAQLEALRAALVELVQKTPGQRVEEIAKAMKIPTKDLAGPLAGLIEGRKIKTTGQRRGTKYFPS